MTIDRFRNAAPCRVLVLSNPTAGSGARREQIPRLMQLLEESPVESSAIHSVESLREQIVACRAMQRELVVVAAGGDGTLSLASTTLAQNADGMTCDASVIPMPLGTENLLARHYGHNADAASVLETIRHGAPFEMDSGEANDQPFLIMATCGFDAEVVRRMHQSRKGNIRRYSYTAPILRAIRDYRFPKLEIRVDGADPIECRWAMVFNLPQYGGGLSIEPDADDNDGQLDVIAFESGSILSGMKYVSGIWLGRHTKFRDVIRCRGRVIEVASDDDVPFQTDGDYAGQLPLKVEVRPRSVRLLLPVSKEGTESRPA